MVCGGHAMNAYDYLRDGQRSIGALSPLFVQRRICRVCHPILPRSRSASSMHAAWWT
jgi:hypothetical protein